MYKTLQIQIQTSIAALLRERYDLELPKLNIELPPKIEFGEMALPLAFELAKRLKKAPRMLAQELQPALAALPGVASVEIAGAGYLNVKLDRAAVVQRMARDEHAVLAGASFALIEHTSINPNKAAHVGHLRNAVLGDTFARMVRADAYKPGWRTGIQNYIDNTGVQVADIVVGITVLRGMTLSDVGEWLAELIETNQRLDYACWDLYAEVSQWYAADVEQVAARKQVRLDTLHAIEAGGNETAEIGDMIASGVLRRHLQTMERLGIEYDFLPRESEILHLHFWEQARQLMVDKGVLYLETEGKNKGCWVMRRSFSEIEKTGVGGGKGASGVGEVETLGVLHSVHDDSIPGVQDDSIPGVQDDSIQDAQDDSIPGVQDAALSAVDPDAKILIRSNGTVTYVGKDIAYHLWKFGLLPGCEFGLGLFRMYRTHPCWISALADDDAPLEHPKFGHADAVYTVVDSRQDEPQRQVKDALAALGFTEAAARMTHISYAFVGLTARTAEDLGYTLSEEDKARNFIEVSGRKGFGVKADDLIDRMIAAARAEVDTRHPELDETERAAIADAIGVGALRFFLLRFTRNTVIAFDYQDALAFDGETGPYVQYAAVRAANIFRKAGVTEEAALAEFAALSEVDLSTLLDGEDGTSVWEVWLTASRLSLVLEQGIVAAEPAVLARYAFQLAQQFNNFYHRHHILTESDAGRKSLLLATAAVARRELVTVLGWLGITVPSAM